MKSVIIWGGYRLDGKVKCDGAKNAALPIMAATLLSQEPSVIRNVPDLSDVRTMMEMLKALGASVEFCGNEAKIDPGGKLSTEAPYEMVRRMRASFLVAGPLLARCGVISIPLPGGCAIGERPIDLHLKGFSAMGASVDINRGFVRASAGRLHGASVYLDVPSVGATENIMMGAVLAQGETIIDNAAQEPEVVDLANFLNSMGAQVKGAGTAEIRVQGVRDLHGTLYGVIPDRIEAATYLLAAAITRGRVLVEDVIPVHLKSITSKLRECGAVVEEDASSIELDMKGRPRPFTVTTLPYPGFPTDAQAPFMSLATIASGTSIISETVFEKRLGHAEELKRMGAKIFIQGSSAIVDGVPRLQGARVLAGDLRAGAALCLAGLSAEGITEVFGMEHVERGYSNLPGKLALLKARIMNTPLDKAESAGLR